MPLYDYECQECKDTFEEILKMDDRKLPTKSPCKKCGGEIVQLLTGGHLGDPVRLGITRPSGEFKEVLSKIHERTHGSKLNSKLDRNP